MRTVPPSASGTDRTQPRHLFVASLCNDHAHLVLTNEHPNSQPGCGFFVSRARVIEGVLAPSRPISRQWAEARLLIERGTRSGFDELGGGRQIGEFSVPLACQ